MLLVVASLAGCAIGNEDRRHVLNYLDENLAPSDATARWLVSPVALPVGVVAGVADAVVVHPVTQLDDAWWDTTDLLWQFDHDSNFRTVLLTPLSAAATPVVFCVDWLFRAVFDIADHPDAEEDVPEAETPEAETPVGETSQEVGR